MMDPEAWAAAYNSGDIEAILRHVAEDATYLNRRFGVDIAGKAAWRELLQQIVSGWPRREVVVRNSWSGPDHFALEISFSLTAVASTDVPGLRLGPGEGFTAELLLLAETRDGLITAQRDYSAI